MMRTVAALYIISL